MMDKIKEYIKCGTDNNIVVYDSHAKQDVFTCRLLNNMFDQLSIVELYLSKTIYIDNIEAFVLLCQNRELIIHFVDKLEWLQDYYKYYIEELKSSLPDNKRNLVLGIGNSGQIILGAY